MTSRTALTLILLALLLAVATVITMPQQPLDQPVSVGWMKPTTSLMESFRGTATAVAENATPMPQPGQKSVPGAEVTPARLSRHNPAPLLPQPTPSRPWLQAAGAMILWTWLLRESRKLLTLFPKGQDDA